MSFSQGNKHLKIKHLQTRKVKASPATQDRLETCNFQKSKIKVKSFKDEGGKKYTD